MLWRDQTLSRAIKARILIYALLIPVLMGIAFTIFEFDATEKAIRAAGGGF